MMRFPGGKPSGLIEAPQAPVPFDCRLTPPAFPGGKPSGLIEALSGALSVDHRPRSDFSGGETFRPH